MTTKTLVLLLAVSITTAAMAQEGGRGNWGGGQRRTIEERVAQVHKVFDSAYHFDVAKQTKIDSVFAEFHRAQDKLRDEARANFTPGQRPDEATMQAMREKGEELRINRDEKLQGILNEEEYTKWKKEIEPAVQPRRGQGMGGDRQRQ